MESAQIVNPVKENGEARKMALAHWLAADCGIQHVSLQPMVADASFRRYFRIQHQAQSLVVMDAPPPLENCRPFIALSQALRSVGIHAPEVIAADTEQGFLLLTDFGDATYLLSLTHHNAMMLYGHALDTLSVLATCPQSGADYTVPLFTAHWMWQEWAWFKEWFIHRCLGLALPDNIGAIEANYGLLVQSAASQPQVFMHRDYHSANLMVLPKDQVGVLDFQDAFIGPLTYDLASLLRDAYIACPPEQVHHLALSYYARLCEKAIVSEIDAPTFLYYFDLMSLQRNLKALMTFARKQVRDHQPRYLQHVPRTLGYLVNISARYPECSALHQYLQNTVLPTWQQLYP